jgi:hypothetical protein
VGDALVERWNGIRWTRQDVPVLPGAFELFLNSVSCSSNKACIAVGYFSSTSEGGADGPLAEHWDGNRWSYQLLPRPAGSTLHDITLSAVSCTSDGACIGVGNGDYVASSEPRLAITERWDGRHWYVQRIPGAGGAAFAGVSCTSRRACVAVGRRRGRAFVERWDGRRWSVQQFPGVPHSYLYGISCPSPSTCFAVGSQAAPQPASAALVGRWNGKRWSIEPTPRTSAFFDGDIDTLLGVSCTSNTVCTAVGSATDSAAPQVTPLAERRAGGRWSIQLPQTSNARAAGPPPPNFLAGVSCASLTSCIAVGMQSNYRRGSFALVERWNSPIVPPSTGLG